MNVHIFAPFDVSQLFVRKNNDTFLETLWIYLYFRSFGTPLLLLVASAEKSYIAFKNVTFCNTYIEHLLKIAMNACHVWESKLRPSKLEARVNLLTVPNLLKNKL